MWQWYVNASRCSIAFENKILFPFFPYFLPGPVGTTFSSTIQYKYVYHHNRYTLFMPEGMWSCRPTTPWELDRLVIYVRIHINIPRLLNKSDTSDYVHYENPLIFSCFLLHPSLPHTYIPLLFPSAYFFFLPSEKTKRQKKGKETNMQRAMRTTSETRFRVKWWWYVYPGTVSPHPLRWFRDVKVEG